MPHRLEEELKRLAEANRHIAEGRQRLAQQEERLRSFKGNGRDRKMAQRLLATMQESLLVMEKHRDMILRSLDDLKG